MNETDPDQTVPTPPAGDPAGWDAVARAWAQGAGPDADPPEIPGVVDDAEALPAPEGDEGRDAVDDATDEGPLLPDREPAPPEPEPEVVLPPKPPTRRERAALKPHPVPPRRKRGLISTLVRWTFALALIFGIIGPIVVVAAYRVIPPPITYLMVQRMVEGRGFDRRWVPLRKISPTLVRAVIAAEDARFCEHQGFDFEAMKKALRNNERRPGKIRGGSTISQQTAKNIFLWPSRSYVRKGLEAWFTVLIEGLWGKPRIMEVYLNSIEWGPGVYGAEAAARRNFGVSAAKLSPAQAARLAAIVPKPLAWRAAKPGPYIKRRSGKIGAAAGTVRRDGLAGCVL